MVPQFELLQLPCDFWQQNSQYVRLYLAVIRHLVVETVTHSGTECGTLTSWIRPQCATAAPGSMRDLTWTDSLSVFQSIQWNMLTTSAWLCTHFTRACCSASRTGAALCPIWLFMWPFFCNLHQVDTCFVFFKDEIDRYPLVKPFSTSCMSWNYLIALFRVITIGISFNVTYC